MGNRLVLSLITALTLGLAPFSPEPHIWEKIKIIYTNSRPMEALDWIDVLMHGAPWIWLFIELVIMLKPKQNKKAN